MKNSCKKGCRQRGSTGGFTLVELMLVVFVMSILAAFTVPNILLTVSNMKLRGAANDLAGLMQQARILAAKNNPQNPPVYPIRYAVQNGAQVAYVDMNNDGVWNPSIVINGAGVSEPIVGFSTTVTPSAGAPTGSGGQPTPYVLVGDSSTGTPFNNSNTLAFTSRGLPCDFSTPPACSSPAPSYFVYYLSDTRIGRPGWAAVVVTKGGRTRVVMWDGTKWN